MQILSKYAELWSMEIAVIYAVDETKLFHDAMGTAEPCGAPNRMIEVGGLVLLEEKSDIGEWYMGEKSKSTYSFWGNYGDLESAIKGL